MIRFLSFALIFLTCLKLEAQHPEIHPGDPAFIEKFANFDFHGKFSAKIDSDTSSNYFLLDFSKFTNRFERVYFMNLSFSYNAVVNIDPGIDKSRVCFKASLRYPDKEVAGLFDEMEKQVITVSSGWSDDIKAAWLLKNDKYK